MLTLIVLLLMAVPQQGGKVILNAGVPEADFYLDGNFVAVTDDKGMLTMGNFPAGSFSYSIVKKGYSSFKGSFTIGEGETRLLAPTLEKIRESVEPRKDIDLPRKASPLADAPKSAAPRRQVLEEARQSRTEDAPARAPAAAQSEARGAKEEKEPNPIWFPGLILLTIAIFLFIAAIRKRKRREPVLPHLAIDPDTEFPSPPADAANRPDPGFIEALKRREELINAGYVSGKSRIKDSESMKEKEVVIVLPKEAFRVEDDK